MALGTTQRFTMLFCVCEVAFSIYYASVARALTGPGPGEFGNIAELQTALARLLKSGMADLSEESFDEETLDDDRPGSPAESIVLLKKDDLRAIDFRNSMRPWFRGAPWSSLRRQGVYRWLYWSIFNDHMPPPEQMPAAHQVTIDDALDQLQKRTGHFIPEGEGPQPLLLTLDPLNVSFRPLWWYLAVATINRYLESRLQTNYHTQRIKHQDLDFLLRIPQDWDSTSGLRPIVFIHGLGLGLLQYYTVLIDLFDSFPDRPILIPLQPQISQDIFHAHFLKPIPRRDIVPRYASLFTHLGWAAEPIEPASDDETLVADSPDLPTGVTLMSHSNGSYLHAWILKDHSALVDRSCFVDPVVFCSWEGDTCYNFLYRPCRTGIELIMRYFVGSEIGVANVLARHFDWSSNSLWYEEIPHAKDPSKALFVLGGKDDIINAPRVKKYLTSHGIKKGLFYDSAARHGESLIGGGEGYTKIIRWLKAQDE
jgi:hypothetical protein